MVEAGRFEEGSGTRPVTQAEAAEMIELWSRSAPAAGPLLDLRDVMEALHISEDEAQRLLARVRKSPSKPLAPLPLAVVVVLYALLIASIAASILATAASVAVLFHHDSTHYDLRPNYLVLLLCLPWTLAWLCYYRRQVWSVVGGIGRRIVEGKR